MKEVLHYTPRAVGYNAALYIRHDVHRKISKVKVSLKRMCRLVSTNYKVNQQIFKLVLETTD